MPEPCPFLSRSLPIVSIIRPTKTRRRCHGCSAVPNDMGLFIGQSQAFFAYMTQLAQAADAPRAVFERYPWTRHVQIEGKGSNPAFALE